MNSQPSEFSIIKNYFAPLAGKSSFGLADDAAQITPSKGMSLVVTQDAIVEGVHFFGDDKPDQIAKKALRVNLSDLAAKGAKPKYISLALGLGQSWDEAWIKQFAKGLGEDIIFYDVELTGGDTFTTGAGFVISVTAIGEIPEDKYTSRMGAKQGDTIFVTGTIGDSALGLLSRQGKLKSISKPHADYLTNRYLLPNPRVKLEKILQKFASASMDISDGLIGDFDKLCKASGVSGEVKIERIPLSSATKAAILAESYLLETALTGGDDYEILFTIPQKCLVDFNNAIADLDFEVTDIGLISGGQGVKLFDTFGEVVEFTKTSYDHSGENF